MVADDHLATLRAQVAEVVPDGGLDEKLALGRRLRVKLGLDPTAPVVTLGWAVVLRALRRFQLAGHVPVLIVGDFTTLVGDPSGRSEARPPLAPEEVETHAASVLEQFGAILDMEGVELRRNSEWLATLDMADVLRLGRSATVARMLERDDFAKRYAAGKPIWLTEFMYPLLQGYDSVAVRADVELGGTDQLFNLLMGRELQRDAGQSPQVAVTMPLLEGLDGVQKMSQSLGNYVGVRDEPDDMFGKLMSIPDELIVRYLRLCTDVPPAEIDEIELGLRAGSVHPNEAKRRMARSVVELYHGPVASADAERRFDRVHRERRLPDDVPEFPLDRIRTRGDGGVVWLPYALVDSGLAGSTSDARRMVEQGAVRLDGEVLDDADLEFDREALRGRVLQVGRRRFVRMVDPTAAGG